MPKPYIPNDAWAKRAAAEGYRARSVYKLKELDEKHSLIRSGMTVLDIGAAPGSWLQYVSEKIGTGQAVGIDLQPIEPIAKNVRTFVADITDTEAIEGILASIGLTHVDLLLSDIAPSTSGIKGRDAWLSVELSRAVQKLSERLLGSQGTLVMKVFQGAEFEKFLADLRSAFRAVKVATVAASRDRSREVYVVCSGLKV